MKIVTDTPQLLVLDDRPWILGIGMGAGVLAFVYAALQEVWDGNWGGLGFLLGAVAFLGAMAVFVRRTQVVANAAEGWIELRSRTILGYTAVRHQIGEVERAIVETQRGDDSDTHRVTLIIPEGESAGRHPVTPVYSSGDGAHLAAKALNVWLNNYRSWRMVP